jgi:hypothetical protein
MTTTKTATHIDHVIVGPQLANHGQYDVCEEPGERRLNRHPPLPGVPVAPLGPASSRSWSHCHKRQSVTRIPLDFEGRSRWSRCFRVLRDTEALFGRATPGFRPPPTRREIAASADVLVGVVGSGEKPWPGAGRILRLAGRDDAAGAAAVAGRPWAGLNVYSPLQLGIS